MGDHRAILARLELAIEAPVTCFSQDPSAPDLALVLVSKNRDRAEWARARVPLHHATFGAPRWSRNPGDLDWIIMRTLEKDPTRRYETANDLADDILRFLEDESVIARSPSRAYRLKKMMRRNKTVFATGGLQAEKRRKRCQDEFFEPLRRRK